MELTVQFLNYNLKIAKTDLMELSKPMKEYLQKRPRTKCIKINRNITKSQQLFYEQLFHGEMTISKLNSHKKALSFLKINRKDLLLTHSSVQKVQSRTETHACDSILLDTPQIQEEIPIINQTVEESEISKEKKGRPKKGVTEQKIEQLINQFGNEFPFIKEEYDSNLELQKAVTHYEQETKSLFYRCKSDQNRLHLRCWANPEARRKKLERKNVEIDDSCHCEIIFVRRNGKFHVQKCIPHSSTCNYKLHIATEMRIHPPPCVIDEFAEDITKHNIINEDAISYLEGQVRFKLDRGRISRKKRQLSDNKPLNRIINWGKLISLGEKIKSNGGDYCVTYVDESTSIEDTINGSSAEDDEYDDWGDKQEDEHTTANISRLLNRNSEDIKYISSIGFVTKEAIEYSKLEIFFDVLIADATFLTGYHRGNMYIVGVMSPTKTFIPLAWCWALTDNKKYWSPFLQMLLDKGINASAFLTDDGKPMKRAIKDIYKCPMLLCLWHLANRLSPKCQSAFWDMVKSDLQSIYQRKLREFQRDYPSDYKHIENKLDEIKRFDGIKRYGMLADQLIESFNAKISCVKSLHPLFICMELLRLQEKAICKLKSCSESNGYTSYCANIINAQKKLAEKTKINTRYRAGKVMIRRKGTQSPTYYVDKSNGMCNCTFFNDCGIPCMHMYAGIIYCDPGVIINADERYKAEKCHNISIYFDDYDVDDLDELKGFSSIKSKRSWKKKRIKSQREVAVRKVKRNMKNKK